MFINAPWVCCLISNSLPDYLRAKYHDPEPLKEGLCDFFRISPHNNEHAKFWFVLLWQDLLKQS